MKLLLFFLFSANAMSSPWEKCLDLADFNLSADASFLSTSKVKKAGCELTFYTETERKEKFDIDLCDPNIHINTYSSYNSSLPIRVDAGSTNCPLPLFGADFGIDREDSSKYAEARTKILNIYAKFLKVYAEQSRITSFEKLSDQEYKKSEVQVLCTKNLINEYLNDCTAFQSLKDAKSAHKAAPKQVIRKINK